MLSHYQMKEIPYLRILGRTNGSLDVYKRQVLDCFTHTGSFALNAGYAGAKEVTGVDASQLAVCLLYTSRCV